MGKSLKEYLPVALICIAGVVAAACASAQGTTQFRNLDFEQATVPPTPIGELGSVVDPAAAFPGWTVGGSGGIGTVVFYNNLSLGSPAAGLMGPNFPNAAGYNPLQGSYSVLLQYFDIAGGPPTLSQTGMVTAGARSIGFLVAPGLSDARLTLGGVDIPLVPIAGGRLAGDITPFAGSVVQLTFSTVSTSGQGGSLYFDDIRFSSVVVPEPAGLRILGIGVLCLVWRSRAKTRDWQVSFRHPRRRPCSTLDYRPR